MKTGILLSYKGIGSNLLHLSYCHEIANKFGPVTIITLCKNLQPILSEDPLIKEVICLDELRKDSYVELSAFANYIFNLVQKEKKTTHLSLTKIE